MNLNDNRGWILLERLKKNSAFIFILLTMVPSGCQFILTKDKLIIISNVEILQRF